MSELKAGPPPCPKMRRAALQGSPVSQSLPYIENPSEAVTNFQAASLRRRFAIEYYFAATVAPLIWGLPR